MIDIHCGHVLDVLEKLPEKSVHCVVTSPPYYGLRKYSVAPIVWPDGWTGHLGNEPSPDLFVQHLVTIFRAVRRVMRDDATLWVNLGDSYAGSGGPGSQNDGKKDFEMFDNANSDVADLEPLNLIGTPWRFAFAMQADGWILRSGVTWCKRSLMPESVMGWRWERHRFKTKNSEQPRREQSVRKLGNNSTFPKPATYTDCPGCRACTPNGGYILRKANWRPTSATEMIFMFSKTDSYYADREAVLQPLANGSKNRYAYAFGGEKNTNLFSSDDKTAVVGNRNEPQGRNLWNYWFLAPKALHEAHYASFPPELPQRCIEVSTSAKGVCSKCGAQWARVVEHTVSSSQQREGYLLESGREDGGGTRHGTFIDAKTKTIDWKPTCSCQDAECIPAIALDPFIGSGTTAIVASGLGRRCIGIELSQKYVDIIRKRLGLFWKETRSDPRRDAQLSSAQNNLSPTQTTQTS